jgi:AhpD family alkylhydroperoxidase
MSRSSTEHEIVEALGQVPDFFKDLPDAQLDREWATFKEFQLGDTVLSAREKHLIGYAVAAATHCPYCTYFHQSATKMMGTSDQQLEEARRIASETLKWSTYLHGKQQDLDAFRRQTDEIGRHLGKQAAKRAA